MSGLRFIPPRVPMVDSNGNVTREWYLFLQGVFDRVGGADGVSTSDLSASAFEDAGIEETKAMLFSSTFALSQNPPAQYDQIVADLQAELSSQRDLIAELTKTIQGIQQGTLI